MGNRIRISCIYFLLLCSSFTAEVSLSEDGFNLSSQVPYEVLNVSRFATRDQIDRAYETAIDLYRRPVNRDRIRRAYALMKDAAADVDDYPYRLPAVIGQPDLYEAAIERIQNSPSYKALWAEVNFVAESPSAADKLSFWTDEQEDLIDRALLNRFYEIIGESGEDWIEVGKGLDGLFRRPFLNHLNPFPAMINAAKQLKNPSLALKLMVLERPPDEIDDMSEGLRAFYQEQVFQAIWREVYFKLKESGIAHAEQKLKQAVQEIRKTSRPGYVDPSEPSSGKGGHWYDHHREDEFYADLIRAHWSSEADFNLFLDFQSEKARVLRQKALISDVLNRARGVLLWSPAAALWLGSAIYLGTTESILPRGEALAGLAGAAGLMTVAHSVRRSNAIAGYLGQNEKVTRILAGIQASSHLLDCRKIWAGLGSK